MLRPQSNALKDVNAALVRVRKRNGASREFQLLIVLAAAIAISASGSHLAAFWLKIKTKEGQAFTIGKPTGKPPVLLAGSSLADYGFSWEPISTQLDREIRTWGIAGSSPFEWEQFQQQVPEAGSTFIVVAALDLDEVLICDFRAAIVTFGHAIKTLRESRMGWKYSKRAMSQYPMTWLRTLFPTLGRSRGLMGKLLINVKSLIRPSASTSETEAGPTISFGRSADDGEYKRQRISDWSEAKIIGKVVAMRVGFQGHQSFNGPKRRAFERMLQYADQKGQTFVIVLPVSQTYAKEFLRPEIAQEFQDALGELQRSAPRSEWLRLDELPALSSDDNFCDLGHLNVFGKQIATQALQEWLRQPRRQP